MGTEARFEIVERVLKRERKNSREFQRAGPEKKKECLPNFFRGTQGKYEETEDTGLGSRVSVV